MYRTLATALAGAAAALLLAPPALADDPAPADPPGVDTAGLTPPQLEVLRRVLAEEFCYCGCPHTLDGCLREHGACKHAPRMARLAVRLASQGATVADVHRVLRDYYSGFDRRKRARLDVTDFGPPLGDPAAPVALVEFSDFTCPFCQRVKPELDRFVEENRGRVRLYYKPFPIASHEHSMDAALAGEWARDRGLFWKMYDQLFAHPHQLAPGDLAGYAAGIGGDPDDLAAALQSGHDRGRVEASQAEGRAARMTGTPTLYLNGHKLELPYGDDVREVLQFALEDEEEWAKRGGWERD